MIETYSPYKILEMHIGSYGDTGTIGGLTKQGLINSLEVESQIKNITKKAEGSIIVKKPKVESVNLMIDAHWCASVLRDMDGLSSEGLKAGVFGLPEFPKGKALVITAKVEDENQKIKYVAFPNVCAPNGLKFEVDNDSDEIVSLEKELECLKDANGYFYYEAFESELTDENTKTKWLTTFTPDLVKQSAGV